MTKIVYFSKKNHVV